MTTANATPLDDAIAARQRGNYAHALKIFKSLAAHGDAKAQYNLGLMYENGQGVTQDYKEAVKWCRLAADQGLAEAQYNLGLIYRDGEGVTQDYKETVKWYRLAAAQGDASTQYNLGLMYGKGQGVTQDYKETVKWYKASCRSRVCRSAIQPRSDVSLRLWSSSGLHQRSHVA